MRDSRDGDTAESARGQVEELRSQLFRARSRISELETALKRVAEQYDNAERELESSRQPFALRVIEGLAPVGQWLRYQWARVRGRENASAVVVYNGISRASAWNLLGGRETARKTFRRFGWSVEVLEATSVARSRTTVDLAVALTPVDELGQFPGAFRVALVTESTKESFVPHVLDMYDLVCVGSTEVGKLLRGKVHHDPVQIKERPVEQILDVVQSRLHQAHVTIATAVTKPKMAERWGDTHFARALGRSISRHGFNVRVARRGDPLDSKATDVALHLRGLAPAKPVAGALNVLWIISHPGEVSPQECEAFDEVFSASETFAERLRGELGREVHVLPQATDPDLFYPSEDAESEIEDGTLLFVGNSRGYFRPAVRWAVELELRIVVYGSGWSSFLNDKQIGGEYYPNERLSELYSSAGIILNDHWSDMAEYGFISNRIFDALASGAFVVSDHVSGVDEFFAGAVPTFKTKADLLSIVEQYEMRREECQALATRGRAMVLEKHTFEMRAAEILEILSGVLEEKGIA